MHRLQACKKGFRRSGAPQTVDKPYEKVSEGHHAPLTGFVSTGYAGRAWWFRPKAKPFFAFFTVSFADSEKCKLDKVAKPLCRHTEKGLRRSGAPLVCTGKKLTPCRCSRGRPQSCDAPCRGCRCGHRTGTDGDRSDRDALQSACAPDP